MERDETEWRTETWTFMEKGNQGKRTRTSLQRKRTEEGKQIRCPKNET